ncbi:MAG: acyl-CoA thioesterase [Hyphomonadaceae bacterium]|nr:acyl-CoA thioesterase [Clostridia bacterium]
MISAKTPQSTEIHMTELVLPNDTNLLGNLLGGRLMHWIDISGAMVASRHAQKTVATVAMDSLDFRHPIKMGELVMLHAKITWVGKTSMEVLVNVCGENLKTGEVIKTNQAFLTFVALDEQGLPSAVPALILETAQEQVLHAQAQDRKKARLQRKQQ